MQKRMRLRLVRCSIYAAPTFLVEEEAEEEEAGAALTTTMTTTKTRAACTKTDN
jgi:hypothetical protein